VRQHTRSQAESPLQRSIGRFAAWSTPDQENNATERLGGSLVVSARTAVTFGKTGRLCLACQLWRLDPEAKAPR
jgi:hypothetical protein